MNARTLCFIVVVILSIAFYGCAFQPTPVAPWPGDSTFCKHAACGMLEEIINER